MPTIRIEGVPDEVLAVLQQRAATAGLSLEYYLLALIEADTSSANPDIP
jgi:hypothetical protein